MTRLVSRNQLWTLFLRLVILAAARGEKLTGDRAGDAGETFLRTGVDSIYAPRIDFERNACQRGDSINNHQAVILASEGAESLSVTPYTGRGFTMDKGNRHRIRMFL